MCESWVQEACGQDSLLEMNESLPKSLGEVLQRRQGGGAREKLEGLQLDTSLTGKEC